VNLLRRVVFVLETHDIPFALIGAAAMAAHGVSRSTTDVDLLTTDRRVLGREIWTAENAVDIRRGDADDPLAGVVRVSAAHTPDVDIVVGRHAWQARAVAEAAPVTIEGVSIPVVGAHALVLLKLFAGGPQDAWDIQQLLTAAEEQVVAAVERDLNELPAASATLWKRIRSEM
jgi:predicted nucleotidyltransferase